MGNTRLFFIDTENIPHPDLSTYAEKADNCTYFVFHNLTYKITKQPKHKYIKVITEGRKNALDFVLCSYLGTEVEKRGKSAIYYIVSNDKGYDVVVEHWLDKGYAIRRIGLKDIQNVIEEPKPEPEPIKAKVVIANKPLTDGITDKDISNTLNQFMKLAPEHKISNICVSNVVNSALSKYSDQQKEDMVKYLMQGDFSFLQGVKITLNDSVRNDFKGYVKGVSNKNIKKCIDGYNSLTVDQQQHQTDITKMIRRVLPNHSSTKQSEIAVYLLSQYSLNAKIKKVG
jgi:hypothetical protein